MLNASMSSSKNRVSRQGQSIISIEGWVGLSFINGLVDSFRSLTGSEVLEQILLDSSGNTRARLAALLDGDIAEPNGNRFPQTASVIGQQGRLTPGDAIECGTQDSSLASITQSEHHRPKRQRMNDGDNDAGELQYWDVANDAWIPPLPSVSFLEAVVEAHFQTVHHWIPILHETRFRAKFKDPVERQKLSILLHALLSASIKYVDFEEFGMSVHDVARQIRVSQGTVMSHAMESLSIENTQALVIIAFDYVRIMTTPLLNYVLKI